MALHVAVLPRPNGPYEAPSTTYFEVDGPAGLTGAELARALGDLGYEGLWPAGAVPLEQVGELPTQGMLTLTPFARPSSKLSTTTQVWLVAVSGPDCGRRVKLARGTYSIGRGECDLQAADPALSRHHADIIVDHTSIALLEVGHPPGHTRAGGPTRPKLLAVGDGFTLGNTTFRVCSADAQGTIPPPTDNAAMWPPPISRLRGSKGSTSRPWMMITAAVLPLGVGIALALALGSWIFLAFSALGLLTGGVSTCTELIGRRRLRRAIRTLSTTRLAEMEQAAPPVGLCLLRRDRTSPPADDGSASAAPTHAVRLGTGRVMPPIRVEPPTDRMPRVRRLLGPVTVAVPCGSVGRIKGTGPMFGPVLRSVVYQLARSCSRNGAVLVVAGETRALPPEARYLPGIVPCPDEPQARSLLSGLPSGSVVLATPALRDVSGLLAAVQAVDGRGPSPAVILTAVAPPEPAWTIDTDSTTLFQGDERIMVSLDGIAASTLAATALSADPEYPPASDGRQLPPHSDPRHAAGTALAAWRSSSADALVCGLGHSSGVPLLLDFVEDGPHVLVAGTTGSGKSELLKSMTMDLVSRYGPDQLSLVLLDFKGGSTLGPYAGTPHCQSLVTDLNVESGERLLSGLRVEVRRRESLFRDAGAEDYTRYRQLAGSVSPPLPRLLVVVDEFRVLTDELPGAVDELMRIATVGRSLGLHLLLSTQRPQGVVTAAMRANINSVISLRLLNASDSQELVGSPSAAELSPAQPGCGFMRRAGEQPRFFRSVPVQPGAPIWPVREIGPGFQDVRTVATIRGRPAAETSPTTAVQSLMSGLPERRMPVASFAPPLPKELAELPAQLAGQHPEGAIALGMVDDISHQCLTPLWWFPEEQRRLSVVGGPGSSAAAAVLRLICLIASGDPERHVYILDGSGAFPAMSGLPRVAGYVGVDEPERVAQLLDIVGAGPSLSRGEPMRVLVVSGLAAWNATMGASAFADLDDRLAALARAAGQLNIGLVAFGDRDLTSSRFHSLAEHRLYLRFGLGPETLLGWPQLRATAPYPGRAVWVGPTTEEQGVVAQLSTSAPTDAAPPALRTIRRCLPLPDTVSLGRLPLGEVRPGHYPLGLCGPDNRPWTWEPGKVGLVLGGPRTGKTGLIDLLARQLAGVTDTLSGLPPERHLHDVLLLDDILDLSDHEIAQVDERIRSGGHVVMTAPPDRAALLRLPASARLLPPRGFLVLNPRLASDGDVPGWRVAPHRRARPGRGLAMTRGVLVDVQCVQADS